MGREAKQKFFESEAKKLPTGRVGSAEDVAESYVYLMKDTKITGSVIHTNGGSFLN